MPTQARYRGFTLIEMLLVISLIALLISMLLPALGKSRQSARAAWCGSNQRQLVEALTMYADLANYYPAGLDAAPNNNDRIWLWPPQLRRFTDRDQRIFHCPQAPASTEWDYRTTPGEPAFFGYDENETRIRGYTYKFSYGYNVWGAFMVQNPNTGLGVYRNHPYLDAARVAAVKNPSDMVAFADSNPNDFWSGFIGPYRTGQWPSRMHMGNPNVAFVDMHVEIVDRTELVDVVLNRESNQRWNNDHQPHLLNTGTIQNDGVPEFP
ncbi:MAG: type II secretion system protein [Phycisphaeraceae bacterium]